MIQVKNGKVLKTSLPKNGFLADGRAVSNYNHLPQQILEDEGWVEPKVVMPPLGKDQEYGSLKYEQVKDEWVETREVVDKPPVIEVVDPLDELRRRIEALEGSAEVRRNG